MLGPRDPPQPLPSPLYHGRRESAHFDGLGGLQGATTLGEDPEHGPRHRRQRRAPARLHVLRGRRCAQPGINEKIRVIERTERPLVLF